MPSSLRRHSRNRARRQFRRIFLEQLEDRSLLAAVITVNSVLDTNARDSALTLREAIMINNRTLPLGSLTAGELAQVSGTPTSTDTDTIAFNITGTGVHTIAPASALPTITDSVIIDGYTQPGASPNTNGPLLGDNAVLQIELSGTNIGSSAHGLFFNGVSGATIRGLAINSFSQSGLHFLNGSNNTIEGNFLGTDPTGKIARPNVFYGIDFFAGPTVPATAANNTIGGAKPASRNLISGNHSYGISLVGSATGNVFLQSTVVQGNFIGTDITGTLPLGNAAGIFVAPGATNTIIGGAAAAEGNLVSGNLGEGISLGGFQTCAGSGINNGNATGSVVQGNRIGADVTGALALGNGKNGIAVGLDSTSLEVIGGVNAGEGNVIAFNALHGIGVLSSHAAIESNSIYANGQLGIHLGFGCSPTANDTDDADSGPNNLQNSPVISAATLTASKLSMNYVVSSTTANSSYPLRVEFFKADADGQEGKTFLGSDSYIATDAGTTKFVTFTPAATIAVGDKIVATATDSAGNTSEFSASTRLPAPTCNTVVTNTNDSGTGSLRSAIDCANSTVGIDTISFNVPGSGVHTISPTSALPTITDPVIIDGYTQAGASKNTLTVGDNAVLQIELDGSQAPSGTSGLIISAGSSTVRGLVINRFSEVGIDLSVSGSDAIVGNFIGTDPAGLINRGNFFVGIDVTSGNADVIGGTAAGDRNVISGSIVGITLDGGMGHVVAGNYIGTDHTGLRSLGNRADAIDVTHSNGNRIGGAEPGAGNVLSGNFGNGITISAANDTVIQGNIVGLGPDGNTIVANGVGESLGGAIGLYNGSHGTLIGGATTNARNIISGNLHDGIYLSKVFPADSPNRVQGNFIGTDITGTLSRGNSGAGVRFASTNGIVGGQGSGEGNLISGNGIGVAVVSQESFDTPANNSVLGNSIRSNVGLGIDLTGDGVTTNDANDADSGPNNLQNFPLISAAVLDGSTLSVTYQVTSATTNSAYPLRVEFFKADVDGQEGDTFLGFDTYGAAEATTVKQFSFGLTAALAAGDKIVATATDSAGNTSEFSPNQLVLSAGNPDLPPAIISNGGGASASINVPENTTAVTDVDATDLDVGTTLTYSISGGADAIKFAINATSGVLTFVSAPNYESPADSGANNVYDVVVQVSDGSLSDFQALAVAVTNINEAPTITSNGGVASASISVPENTKSVADVDATDPDAGSTVTYSISGGLDSARFSINATTGVLTFSSAPNFEAPTDSGSNNVYDLVVQASDGSLTARQTLAVTVTNVSEAPIITSNGGGASASISIPETTTGVTDVDATDQDAGTTLTYGIAGGADSAKFSINSATGILSFLVAPNYESPTDSGLNNVYDLTVQVTDGSLSDSQTLAVTVTNVNEAPSITSNGSGSSASINIPENTTAVADVDATDPDAVATLTYSINGGADAAKFSINATTGVLTFVSAPDFESPTDAGANNVYDVIVLVSDGISVDSQTLAVTVTDVVEAGSQNHIPVAVDDTATVSEDQFQIISAPGILANDTDADAGDTKSVVAINGQAIGTIGFPLTLPSGALLTVQTDGTVVYDPNGQFEALRAGQIATDSFTYTMADSHGATSSATVRLTIQGGNDVPTAVNDSAAVNENAVLTVASPGVLANDTDPDAGDTKAVVAVNGSAAAIGSPIALRSGALVTMQANGAYQYDPNGKFSSVPVGTSAVDSFVYTMADSQGANSFAIVTIRIDGVNEAPVITSNGGLSTASVNIDENTTAVADVDASDPDAGQTLRFSILGGADSGKFAIDSTSGVLTFAAAPDYENPTDSDTNNVYLVVVGVSDGTDTDSQTLSVTVRNVNEAPVITSNGGGGSASINVPENTTAVTDVDATDPDAQTNLIYLLTGGTDAGKFSLDRTSGVLTFAPAPNYEDPVDSDGNNVYLIVVTASDGSLLDSQTLTVTVLDVNEPPIAQDDSSETSEDAPLTIAAPGLLANDTDPDGGDVKTVVGVNGLEANVGTQILLTSGALLRVNRDGSYRYDPNGAFEFLAAGTSQNDYFTYTMADRQGATSSGTVTIRIDGANDAPVAENDQFSTDEDTLLSVNPTGVLANDYDPDGDKLMLAPRSQPAHGQLTLRMDGSFTYQPRPDYNGPDSFTYQLSDGQTSSNIATVTISVKAVNDRPVVSLGGNLTVDEGTAISVHGSFTDPDSGDAWTATVDYGDGTHQSLPLAADKTFSLGHAYRDNGLYTVTVAVQDSGPLTGTASFQVGVNNVAPQQLTWSGPGPAPSGQSVVFAGGFTDPGLADTETATVDWGDGSTSDATVTGGNGVWQVQASHTFTANGVYSVVVTVKDDDGGTSSKSATMDVGGAFVSHGVLTIVGSDQRDDLKLTLAGQSLIVSGTLGGVAISQSIPLTSVQRIMADLLGGDDSFTVDAKIKLPLLVNGGAGNDVIKAGGGLSVLIGGSGQDSLTGGATTDLLIAGTTAYDANSAALASILSEWSSSRSFPTRIKNLRTGTGAVLQGTGIKLVVGTTVLNDSSVDTLLGGGDFDWFMLDGKKDKIKDLIRGEQYN